MYAIRSYYDYNRANSYYQKGKLSLQANPQLTTEQWNRITSYNVCYTKLLRDMENTFAAVPVSGKDHALLFTDLQGSIFTQIGSYNFV